MRPVIKGNPPKYPFWDEANEKSTKTTFKQDGAVAVVYNDKNVGSKKGPPVTFSMYKIMKDVFNVTILDYVFPNPKKGYPSKAISDMKKLLARRYRPAHPDLVGMLGNFCSFCELPLPNSYLDVEHRAAKTPYPTYFLWWWNFLLACTSCNSTKGDNPDRATTTGWAGGGTPTEEDLIDQIKKRYYWPDLNGGTFRTFRNDFYRDTDAAYPVELLTDEYPSRDNVLVAHAMDTVVANVWENGAMRNNRRVECRIWINGASNRATRTVALTGLDRHETERSMYRTVAWLACCMQLKRLFAAVARAGAPHKNAEFDDQWASLLELAKLRGFYTTWLNVLEEVGFPAGVATGGYANLGAKFAYDTNPLNNPGHPLQTVPGTNYAQVP